MDERIGNYCSCCGMDLTETDDFGRLFPFVGKGGKYWCLECYTFLFEKLDHDDSRVTAYKEGKKDWYLAHLPENKLPRPQWIEDFIKIRKGFNYEKNY